MSLMMFNGVQLNFLLHKGELPKATTWGTGVPISARVATPAGLLFY
jgi:hypothetical protein